MQRCVFIFWEDSCFYSYTCTNSLFSIAADPSHLIVLCCNHNIQTLFICFDFMSTFAPTNLSSVSNQFSIITAQNLTSRNSEFLWQFFITPLHGGTCDITDSKITELKVFTTFNNSTIGLTKTRFSDVTARQSVHRGRLLRTVNSLSGVPFPCLTWELATSSQHDGNSQAFCSTIRVAKNFSER